MGMLVPEHWGGAGVDHVAMRWRWRRWRRATARSRTMVSVHNSVVCMPLLTYGTDAQKERFLVPLARGEMLGCLLPDRAAGRLRRRRDHDPRGARRRRLRAQRHQAVHHLRPHADVALVFAVTDPRGRQAAASPPSSSHRRRRATTSRGVEKKLGQRASDTAQIAFEDCVVPAENRLGEEGEGLPHRARQPGGRAHRHRRAGDRHGARGVRARRSPTRASAGVRQADHRAPGDRLPPGRHGDRDRGRAPAVLARGDACATPASPA